jgi:hypothetical protein
MKKKNSPEKLIITIYGHEKKNSHKIYYTDKKINK